MTCRSSVPFRSFPTVFATPRRKIVSCRPLANVQLISQSDKIGDYLDLPEVRAKLGVDKSVGKFASCSGPVGNAFHMALDSTDQTWLYVGQLLERGVRVLNVSYLLLKSDRIELTGTVRWYARLDL